MCLQRRPDVGCGMNIIQLNMAATEKEPSETVAGELEENDRLSVDDCTELGPGDQTEHGKIKDVVSNP